MWTRCFYRIDKFNLYQSIKIKYFIWLYLNIVIYIIYKVNYNMSAQEKAAQGIYPQSWRQTRPGLLEIAAVNPQYLPQNLEVKLLS